MTIESAAALKGSQFDPEWTVLSSHSFLSHIQHNVALVLFVLQQTLQKHELCNTQTSDTVAVVLV